MKKLLLLALVGLTVLTGCPSGTEPAQTPTKVEAGTTIDLAQTSAFLTVADACGVNAVAWTYSGTSTNPADGSITQAGVFTAPVCGSTLIGTTVTITARCSTVPTAFATANIVVGSELVTAITFVAADVKLCGATACRAPNPVAIVLPVCAPSPAPQTTIQFYAQISTTCGPAVAFSPSAPPTGVPACTF